MAIGSTPSWITPSVINTVADGYSFNSNPVLLAWTPIVGPASVVLLNGQLPPGMGWTALTNSVQLQGQINGVLTTTNYQFSFRLVYSGGVVDRTFSLRVTGSSITSDLSWVTPLNSNLGILTPNSPVSFAVIAQTLDNTAITYSISSFHLIQGCSIQENSGEISFDIGWKPVKNYNAGYDFVFNNNQLYQCQTSGISSIQGGPIGTGSLIVDTESSSWEPLAIYQTGEVVSTSSGMIYLCENGGTSGTVAPSAVGGTIQDGSVTWNYQSQAALWNHVSAGEAVPIILDITAQSASSITGNFSVNLISTPDSPIWVTSPGVINTVKAGEWVGVTLQTLNPDMDVVAFTGENLPSWIQVGSITGILWGQAPLISVTTTYEFSIVASNSAGSTVQNFAVEVEKVAVSLSWVTQSDLGTVNDGENSWLTVRATSTVVSDLITYTLTGGSLPPQTKVDNQTGCITGFIDYHSQNQTYWFEITANSASAQIVQQFQLTVEAQLLGQNASLSIPITGDDKLNILSLNNDGVISYNGLFNPADPNWGRYSAPKINIIAGLPVDNAVAIADAIAPLMSSFEITMETVNVTQITNLPYQTLFLTIKDSNSLSLWKPTTTYLAGARVVTPSGAEFLAKIGGISGNWPAPVGTGVGTTISDGAILWLQEGGGDFSRSWNYPLPWQPQHPYTQGQTVISNGIRYTATVSGSSGDIAPAGEGSINDGDQVWTTVGIGVQPNLLTPSNITNLRQALKSSFGSQANWTELLPLWQKELNAGYIPSIELAAITLQGSQVFLSQPSINQNFIGQTIRVNQLDLTLQGIVPEGNTEFDVVFDMGCTGFAEIRSASETSVDSGKTRFDNGIIVFDSSQNLVLGLNSSSTIRDFNTALATTRENYPYSIYGAAWSLPLSSPNI